MKILTNALLLGSRFSGVQYATENLLQGMQVAGTGEHHIEVLLPEDYSGQLQRRTAFGIKKIKLDALGRAARIFFEHVRIGHYFHKNKFDLYHATSYILPWFCRLPSVLTVHDLIALDHPGYCQNESAVYFGLCLPRSIKRASRIIAVSETVKQDIIRKFDIDARKITVVYHGVENAFKKITCSDTLDRIRLKYRLPEKFILFVGNLEPKKNLERLIAAFLLLKEKNHIPQQLVIVGKDGWKSSDVFKKIRESPLAGAIICTGYADREDLPALYSLADLFAFPSLYEGFGLPVLEAMACGTPVLISNRGALPEITGNIFPQVDADNVTDIAAGMHSCLTNESLRQKNIAHGLQRAKDFTWEAAARRTLTVYESMQTTLK